MRNSCFDCARKHLGQAEVLLVESELGYPEHFWLAVGHIAEAEHEIMSKRPDLAHYIRSFRVDLIENQRIDQFPTVKIIRVLTEALSLGLDDD